MIDIRKTETEFPKELISNYHPIAIFGLGFHDLLKLNWILLLKVNFGLEISSDIKKQELIEIYLERCVAKSIAWATNTITYCEIIR